MKRNIGMLLAAALGLGCRGLGGADGAPADASQIAAEIEGESITIAELDTRAKERLYLRETRDGDASLVYELRKEALEAWIEERALAREAQRRGIAVEAMLAEEMAARGPVSDEEVAAFFAQHSARLPGRTLEELSPDIRRHLESQREQEVRQALIARSEVSLHLEPPRVTVSSSGPSLGPPDAPVTLVEFSDFQCPFCARALPTIKALRERYPTQLRVVYKHLPLESIHPRARAAAEASVCAEEQGQFWPFHDRLFENPNALGDAELRAHAEAVGMDLAAYDSCRSGPQLAERVAADIAEAGAAGVTGTPAFVLNGVLLRGLQPPDALAALIDRELAAAAQTAGARQASP